MKYLYLLISFIILSGSGQAQDYQQQKAYTDLLDLHKIIVQFKPSVSAQQQKKLLLENPLIYDGLAIPHPQLTIAHTNVQEAQTYFGLIQWLEQQPEVNYAGVYFKNEEGDSRGILNEILIKLKKPQDIELIDKLLKEGKISDSSPTRMRNLYKLQLDKNSPVNILDLAIELHQSGQFHFAEPNYLVNPNTATVDDPLFARQWALENSGSGIQNSGIPGADMRLVEAWTITTGAPSVKVAIIDSGVDTLHPDLVNNLLGGYSAIGDSSKGYPSFNYEQDGHGTCCAGIVAAEGDNGIGTAGVAYDCSILPVKIFYYVDTSLQGIPLGVIAFSTSSWMADGLTWAWQSAGAEVLSNSWGLSDLFLPFLPGSPATVDSAIYDAATLGRGGKGAVMVFSSGNEGTPPIWPGRDTNAISVNATSMCDEPKSTSSCDGENWTGNFGAGLEVSAPGVYITTTDARGNLGFQPGDSTYFFNGTSAACPNAAGVVALMLSLDPNLDLAETRRLLAKSAEKVTNGGVVYDSLAQHGYWSEGLGYGRVDAYWALRMVQNPTLGNIEAEQSPVFSVFPNPAKEIINVRHGLTEGQTAELLVYNHLGQLVAQRSVYGSTYSSFSVNEFAAGPYFVSLQTESNLQTLKFLIIK